MCIWPKLRAIGCLQQSGFSHHAWLQLSVHDLPSCNYRLPYRRADVVMIYSSHHSQAHHTKKTTLAAHDISRSDIKGRGMLDDKVSPRVLRKFVRFYPIYYQAYAMAHKTRAYPDAVSTILCLPLSAATATCNATIVLGSAMISHWTNGLIVLI